MNRYTLIIILILICNALAAQPYRTQAISEEIHTIQVNINGNPAINPVINLNSSDYIHISFDRLSDDSFNRLRYRIRHCDAYWNPSTSISDIDYLNGFNDNLIDDYDTSVNTSVDYTHFSLAIPNRDAAVKLSGNYVVEIYEEGRPDDVLLTACFSVVDTAVSIGATVSSNTDIDFNRHHQQLSFTIHHQGFNIRDPRSELFVFALQNNRLDTERSKIMPTYINPNKIIYEHNKELIFEAGNEYRRFETSSYRYNGMNVAHVEYNRPGYTMDIVTDKVRANRSYSYDQDQNGRTFIRSNETDYPETEADYFTTNFTLEMDRPLVEDIYINGDFTNNTFSDKYKLKYDQDNRVYHLSLLLKQGLYNYQYLTKEGRNFSTGKVEGNYFEAENEYTVYVYYRPAGQRYDSLIGVQNIRSRDK
ncbi:hypothetical protein GGR21_001188 [Dysgonomonas hofstadii]|uniref:Type 9 secretion system plug protein N-terminal domain-containing protein n=1 Tax=Dysgonomonas hofstadii TaxID=637886 RepID=A0A840CKX1_9BACT|nr:DUF5103 domain-containing protein [Dysgonomonas hofstadii]MBB4035299.1 hypothetical protein [Dysgonomonas hofstadii]